MRIGRVVAAGYLCVTAAFPAAAEDVSALQAGLLSKLNEFRDRDGFPGVTAAVALPDGQIVVAASGLADVEASRAMSPETPMLAASIGKTLVAATALSLESEGQLSLMGHLADYLGDRPWFPELPNANTITLSQLLRHQSGLPDHPHLPEFQAAAKARIAAGEHAFTPKELLGFVTGREAPRGPVFGHGGRIPTYVSSLRHYADHGVTVAFQINSDAGVLDDSSDVVPALEVALADLAIDAEHDCPTPEEATVESGPGVDANDRKCVKAPVDQPLTVTNANGRRTCRR